MEARPQKLYKVLADLVAAYRNTLRSGNHEWTAKHRTAIERAVREYMPSGSGFDNGTKIDLDQSDGHKKLVFYTDFHRMNDRGFYDGWLSYTITATPAFRGVHVHIKRTRGPKDVHLAEHVGEAVVEALNARIR